MMSCGRPVDIHLYPIFLSLLQGIYRALRNLVGLETHQGAVNIKKQCFYLLIHTNIFYTLIIYNAKSAL